MILPFPHCAQVLTAQSLEKTEKFCFAEPSALRTAPSPEDVVLTISEASCGYADNCVLHDVDLQVSRCSRVAIVGDNGAGKSTLLKSLTGDLELLAGTKTGDDRLRIATVTQHHMEQLRDEDGEVSASQYLRERFSCRSDQEARGRLGRFVDGAVANGVSVR